VVSSGVQPKTNGTVSVRVDTVDGMPGSRPVIEAIDLVKRFGADVAVDGVSFVCRKELCWGCWAPTARVRPPWCG
jgi:hypothetical protein